MKECGHYSIVPYLSKTWRQRRMISNTSHNNTFATYLDKAGTGVVSIMFRDYL